MVKLLSILVAVFLTLSSTSLVACMCGDPPVTTADSSGADAIFSGTVIDVSSDWSNGWIVTFSVDRTWRGPHFRTLIVATDDAGVGCGVRFREGETWLVY